MAQGLSVVTIDDNPIRVASTDQEKVTQFIHNIMQLEALKAGTALLDELTVLNRQAMSASLRITTLERYQHSLSEISKDLEDHYSLTKTPLPDDIRKCAANAEALWLEVGYGYKRALTDLKKELINLKSKNLNKLVLFRILESLKNEALVKYLTYTSPSESFWSDLHKVYYHALQLALEESTPGLDNGRNNATLSLLYKQILLMYLSNPQRLDKAEVLKLSDLVDDLATFSTLRGLGLVEKPSGLFVVQLDDVKPPVAYNKNQHTPNIETDILLITVEVARQVHQQLTLIKANKPLPNNSVDNKAALGDEHLLQHLIQYLGATPVRYFSRQDRDHKAQLMFGFKNAHALFRDNQRSQSSSHSEWQVLNISPTGYALRNSSAPNASIAVGELIAISDDETDAWAMAQIAWVQVMTISTSTDIVEIGVKLIAPSATSTSIEGKNSVMQKAILLPKLSALNQKVSLLVEASNSKPSQSTKIKAGNKTVDIKLGKALESTRYFHQIEYNLIDSDLS